MNHTKKQIYATHAKKNSNKKIEFSKSKALLEDDPVTGKNRNADCRFFNLRKTVPEDIPEVMHNGPKYDYQPSK